MKQHLFIWKLLERGVLYWPFDSINVQNFNILRLGLACKNEFLKAIESGTARVLVQWEVMHANLRRGTGFSSQRSALYFMSTPSP